jgi:glycerol-3-phosphate dehydrogenase
MWRNLSKTQKFLTVASTATASFAYYLNTEKPKPNIYKSTIAIQNEQISLPPSLLGRNKAFAEALETPHDFWHTPSREEMLQKLKDKDEYDLLIVGGGATGAGISVDAVTRGLKVALVERDDFASGK